MSRHVKLDSVQISSHSFLEFEVSQSLLDSFNVEQARDKNKEALDNYGGVQELARKLNVDLNKG